MVVEGGGILPKAFGLLLIRARCLMNKKKPGRARFSPGQNGGQRRETDTAVSVLFLLSDQLSSLLPDDGEFRIYKNEVSPYKLTCSRPVCWAVN